MLTLDEARRRLLEGVTPVGPEELPIDQCHGRILWTDIVATANQPRDPVSAMDGYAIRADGACEGARLEVIGESPAGRPFEGFVGPGQAVRIATGGVLPDGADHVLIQEHAERIGSALKIIQWSSPAPPSFVRPAGYDFRAGDLLARAGESLTPARHALVVAANVAHAAVARRPSVAIVASGDELREPGTDLRRGETINSAAYAVTDLVEIWGEAPRRLETLPDDPAACDARLRSQDFAADVIVTIGGASVGDHDVLRPMLRRMGAEIVFEGIAAQPGKPSWHARFADGRLILGLPGNPASAFVCAHLLLKPLLFRLTARDPSLASAYIRTRLAAGVKANGDRETFMRATVDVDGEGQLRATPFPEQDSSLLVPLAAANALIRRPLNAPPAAQGDITDVLMIEGSPARCVGGPSEAR